jgi:hypothetical protein
MLAMDRVKAAGPTEYGAVEDDDLDVVDDDDMAADRLVLVDRSVLPAVSAPVEPPLVEPVEISRLAALGI